MTTLQIDKDILTVTDGVICHQVNCLKVMGAGLALQIARKWPQVEEAYIDKPVWRLGEAQMVQVGTDLYVANLAGQDGVGRSSVQTDYNALRQALTLAEAFAHAWYLPLYVPYMMGCGLAGGDWDTVLEIIEKVAPGATICKLPE